MLIVIVQLHMHQFDRCGNTFRSRLLWNVLVNTTTESELYLGLLPTVSLLLACLLAIPGRFRRWLVDRSAASESHAAFTFILVFNI